MMGTKSKKGCLIQQLKKERSLKSQVEMVLRAKYPEEYKRWQENKEFDKNKI